MARTAEEQEAIDREHVNLEIACQTALAKLLAFRQKHGLKIEMPQPGPRAANEKVH